ncbi:Ger(x)C family spore germination protein [Paenibacillus sp. N3.4]|uniref:Ger(x)C family spore germination protein n=1 Tax=Paenibacillus sp. N3.4 TaxID=2603222 RepID=UPI0011C82B31|nr:Ger(x)C family spore germination protein [Paenibacillus sp. N3.4]TXK84790.1 Ger(x)C family spore germination protein [Paenibacillus sp. N3.4]
MKKGSILGALILLSTLLSGCWDRHELNDLAIAVGLGFDRNGDQFKVTTQIVNPNEVASKKASGYSTPITTLTATATSTLEAVRKLTTSAPRKIFLSHMRIIVIGEDLARSGISDVMDGISRDHEMRSDFYLIVAKGTTAENVLKILTPIERIPANKMFKTLETSEKSWAPTVSIQLDRFLSNLSNPTRQSVLTGIVINGDVKKGKTKENLGRTNPHAVLAYSGLALFKEDKLLDWMNDQESKGYNYIMGNVRSTIGHVTCPQGGTIAMEVVRSNTKVKGKVVSGKPQIDISIHIEENISEVQCKIDLLAPGAIHELELINEQNLRRIVLSSINKAKKNKADIFGFGDAIESASPKLWTQIKADWDTHFADLQIVIHPDVQIRRLGTTNNSIIER